jgi:uncharacterized protein (DUF362 family)
VERSVIYVAETEDRASFVKAVLERAEGDFAQSQGLKILVKPNIVSREPYPTTTHPQVLASVLDFLLDHRCQIVVADGSALDAGGSDRIIYSHPLSEVCRQRGIELQNAHKHGFRRVRAGSMSLEISALAFDCDYIISLPVLKPHQHAGMTGALKNQFGLLRNRDRLMMHTWLKSLSKGIAGVNAAVRPKLFIVDAVTTYRHANERRHGGGEVRLGYMLAGRDPVALDSFGLDLLKDVEPGLGDKHPEDIAHIAQALKMGLGSTEYKLERVPAK